MLVGLSAPPAHAATVNVKTQGLKFVPAIASAHLGDTVFWTNAATDRHSATSDAPTPWDSGKMNPWRGTYSRVFSVVGSFPYYCDIHRSLNMNGVVKVAVPVTPAKGTTATDYVVTLAKSGTKVPTGYRFVVQKSLNGGAYSTAVTTTATTAHFRATTKGTYRLRAGLQKTSGPLNAAFFSDPSTLTVA